jgi:hypothetical protein
MVVGRHYQSEVKAKRWRQSFSDETRCSMESRSYHCPKSAKETSVGLRAEEGGCDELLINLPSAGVGGGRHSSL